MLPVFIVCYRIAKCIKRNNKGKYFVPLFNDLYFGLWLNEIVCTIVLIMNKLWKSLDFCIITISQFTSYEICLADVIHLCESWFQPKKRLKEQNRADKNSLGSQNMVITYLLKDVQPQCASLTGEITSRHELLRSYGDSYMRLRLIK